MSTNSSATEARGPLRGVRVLDLSRLLPGGFATALLGDLGAEVIKVEQPGVGDYMRWKEPRFGGTSGQSWITDRNKRSVALDLKDQRGVAAFKALAREADVVVESFRPGVLDRLGVGYEDLREVNPAIVLCSISGYGQSGPLKSAAGHDLNYVGRAGLLSITGPREGRPSILGVQVGDLGGSLIAVVGLLAAVVSARQTGEGDHIDVGMTDAAFFWLSVQLGIFFATGEAPEREGVMLNGRFPCYNVYECADGLHLTVGAIEEQFWQALCEAVERPDLIPSRMDGETVDAWREIFRGRRRAEWLALLEPIDACVGPVNDFAAAAEDPQLRAREMILSLADEGGEELAQMGTPIKLRNQPASVRRPGRPLGADTREALRAAGLDEAELDELIAAGVAAEHDPGLGG